MEDSSHKTGDAVLFSFVGNRDPYSNIEEQTYGPILSLLETRTYNRVYLFCTGTSYTERARTVEEICKTITPETQFSFVRLDLASPVDYEEIFVKLKNTLDQLIPSFGRNGTEVSILTDSGTPQMQTTWFLLAKSGYLNAHLLQGVPPQFAGGAYKVKEIDLESSILPNISLKPTGERKDRGERRTTNKNEGPTEQTTSAHSTPDVESVPPVNILFQTAPEEETTTKEVPPEEKPSEEEPVSVGKWITAGSVKVIGKSPAFKKVFDSAMQVAGYNDVSVLISGETGTGKEIVANLIHEQSSRKDKPFLPINCSSIAPALAESELFGYGKGAFTGADKERLGLFRAADGGTVLLDEIGEMPMELQPKLLRVLESKRVLPVGFDREIEVDVRVLAATNQDLERLIEEGRFRRDLYERLRQVTVTMPSLRERGNDVILLAMEFLRQWNDQYHENKTFSEELLTYFADYSWPSNVRGLQNAVTHVCAISRSNILSSELLPAKILENYNRKRELPDVSLSLPKDGIELKALLYQIEEHFYNQALERSNGNKEQAANLLGINPPAFRKALRERFSWDL